MSTIQLTEEQRQLLMKRLTHVEDGFWSTLSSKEKAQYMEIIRIVGLA